MIFQIAMGLLLVTSLCSLLRILVGPNLADRVVALDVALVCLMSAVAIYAHHTKETIFLYLLTVIAIIGFTATVAASKYIENEASKK